MNAPAIPPCCAIALALLVGSARVFAQSAPWNPPAPYAPAPYQPAPWNASVWQPASPSTPPANARIPWEWQSAGVSLGGAHYVESPVVPVSFGEGIGPPSNFVTRGVWVGIEAEYLTKPWLALAARGRFGWIRRGPPNKPEYEYPAGTHVGRLDPQLGDSPAGGTLGLIFRFLPKRTALDAGLTASIGSFRPRFGSYPIVRCATCYDEGQGAYETEAVWPTLRVSRTGLGFVFAAGTGESFVRTHEPGILEILLGYRGDKTEFLGGFGRGLAFRVDRSVGAGYWISFDLSVNPWNRPVPGYASMYSMITVTFTRRWSSFAPL